jgi:hypothetical protein
MSEEFDGTPDAGEVDEGPSSPEIGEILGIGEGPEIYPERTVDETEDSQSEEEDQQAAPDEQAEAAVEPEQEPQPEESDTGFFEYNGKVFPDAESAKQYFDSWNGRLAKSNEDYQAAMAKNTEWQKAYQDGSLYEDFKARYEQEKAASEPEKPTRYNLEEINWDYIKEKIAAGDAITAMQYLSYENGKYLKSEVEKVREELTGALDSELGPQKEMQAARDYSRELMLTAQKSVDPVSGDPRYPEFVEGESYDQAFVQTFARVWKELPYEIALSNTLEGVDLAYLKAKDIMSKQAPPAETTEAPAGVPDPARADAAKRVRDAQGRFAANTEAAATAVGGSESPDVTGRPSAEATFKEAMRKTGTVRNDVLGISE